MRRRVAGKGSRGQLRRASRASEGRACAWLLCPAKGPGCPRKPLGPAAQRGPAPGAGARALTTSLQREPRPGVFAKGPGPGEGTPTVRGGGRTAGRKLRRSPVCRSHAWGALQRSGGRPFPAPAGQRGRGAPQTARPAEPAAPPATPGPSSALATAEPGPAGAGRPDRSRRPALPVTWVPRARGHIKPRNAH